MCYYRGVEKEQRMSKNRRRPHRGRREKKKKAGMLSNIILIVALAVFCVSAFQLVKIVGGYAKGRDEYKKIQSIAINKEDSEPEKGFSVDFDELKGINPDTVGWIRFTRSHQLLIIRLFRQQIMKNIYTKHFRKMIIHLERFF